MHYRVVYDVLNDGFPWFGVLFSIIPFLLAAAYCLEFVDRVRGKRDATGGMAHIPVSALVVSILILSFSGSFLASKTYEAFVHRQQCEEWARAGEYQTTEGTVADYRFCKAGPSFRVADASFDLHERSAGFTGRFNAPGAGEDLLRDGLGVRVAHREGFILRLEVTP